MGKTLEVVGGLLIGGFLIATLTACEQRMELRRVQLPSCRPVVGSVEPKEALGLRWKWAAGPAPEYNQNMATPMVADINGDAVSDFVFTSWTQGGGKSYTSTGVLRVVSGVDGQELWSTAAEIEANQPLGSAAPAIYDLDRDGHPEILVVGSGVLLVYGSTGALLDRQPLAATPPATSRVSVADLDFDGIYELMAGVGAGTSLYHYHFESRTLSAPLLSGVAAMMNVDPRSPGLEVVTASAVYSAALAKLRELAIPDGGSSTGQVAFGNFDGEPDTEIVMRHGPGIRVSIFKGATGAALQTWSEPAEHSAACAARTTRSGSSTGALNVGDLDGDRIPDVTFAGTCWFRGLKSDATGLHSLWQVETRDFSSSATGSSVFDFNGDGRVEVLYNDELFLRIIDGKTGEVLYRLRNDNGTLLENPVVVSLRKGEPASIVLSANSYTGYTQQHDPSAKEDPEGDIVNVTGIRVIQGGDNRWMPTRTLWNQFDYVVTNVLDSLQVPGSIPDFVGISNRTRANVPTLIERCE